MMGVRTYEVIVERVIHVKARNKSEVQAMMDKGELPIYEDETITKFCERKPSREMLVRTPVYSPKIILKRQNNNQQNNNPPQEKPAVETEEHVMPNPLPDNVIPLPVRSESVG